MIHLEKLDPAKTHYIVRHFKEPLGPIDQITGQPWKKYDGTCVLTLHGNAGEIRGIKSVPMGAFFELRDKLREMGLLRLVGERWIGRSKVLKDIPLG